MNTSTVKIGNIKFKVNNGELLLFSLMNEGIFTLGKSQNRNRGGFCGMGVCQECLIELKDGKSKLACQTIVQSDMEIMDYE